MCHCNIYLGKDVVSQGVAATAAQQQMEEISKMPPKSLKHSTQQ